MPSSKEFIEEAFLAEQTFVLKRPPMFQLNKKLGSANRVRVNEVIVNNMGIVFNVTFMVGRNTEDSHKDIGLIEFSKLVS